MSYDFALRYCHPFVLGISHTIFWILSPVWSSPKQRGQLKSNFIEMFIRWSSTNFIFFSFDQKSSLVATTEPRGPSVLNRAFSGMYFSNNFDKILYVPIKFSYGVGQQILYDSFHLQDIGESNGDQYRYLKILNFMSDFNGVFSLYFYLQDHRDTSTKEVLVLLVFNSFNWLEVGGVNIFFPEHNLKF